MSGVESQKVERLLTAASVVAPLLAWMAYVWERFTGVTFVLSRNAREIGDVSTTAHLSRTLQLALVLTLLGAGFRLWRGIQSRAASGQDRPDTRR